MVAEQSNVMASLNLTIHDCKRQTERVEREAKQTVDKMHMDQQR